MIKDRFHIKKNKGFSTVEVVLALAIISLISVTLAGALSYGIFAQSQANMENKANFLLEEGLEATASIKDKSYFLLANGTYGLDVSSGEWIFNGASDSIDGFSRSIQITTIDAYTKQAIVTVNWQNSSGSRSIDSIIQLTNWERLSATNDTWDNATIEATVNLSGNTDATDVLKFGNKLFIARTGSSNNFTVTDIVNLATPVIQGTTSITGNITDLAAYGNYVYVTSTGNSNELNIVNVTDPNSLSVSVVNLPGNSDANGVYVLDTRLFLTRASSGDPELYIYDLTNPATPTLLGSAQINATLYKLFVEGDYAYISTTANNAELMIYNVSNPATPTLASALDLSGNTDATDIARYSLGVALKRGNAISLVNITNPLAPTALNSAGFNVGANSSSIAVGTNHPYIFHSGATADQFTIYDVTNAASPVIVDSIVYSGNLNDIYYDSTVDRVFGAGSDNSIEVVIYRPNP